MAEREILWLGAAPPVAVAGALRAQCITIVRRGKKPGRDEARGPAVVFTSAGELPRGTRTDVRWIWASAAPIADGRRTDAVLRGAYDAVSLARPDGVADLVERIAELLVPDVPVPPTDTIVTASEASRRVIAQVARVAPTSMPVLLTGETGTGKEVMARLVHAWSPRRQKRFVPINCAAIPDELMEAELFGYARGAFSGAVQRYDGQLMAAEGGSVFLDEIDDTPLETQVKLLRVLEDRVVSRLGENVWHEVDFRILTATNRELPPLIEAGLFGADLYERLAIVRIHLVPLRERLEDLPDLAAHFIARFAKEQQRQAVASIRDDALRALGAYPWPGNIRELRNVLYETLVYKRAGDRIILSDLPRRILTQAREFRREPLVDHGHIARKIGSGTMRLRDEVSALERAALDEAMKRAGGNAAEAARLLGAVGRGKARDPGGTVRAMMKRLGNLRI